MRIVILPNVRARIDPAKYFPCLVGSFTIPLSYS